MSRTSIALEPMPCADTAVQQKDGGTENSIRLQGAEISSNKNDIARPETRFNLSKTRMMLVIVNVSSVTFLRSVVEGLVIVQLPTIAADIHLNQGLLLWPVSIYPLTCGCTLLPLGSITDIVGSRPMYLIGCGLQCIFTLALGLSTTGSQLLIFRAFSGIALSFCLPSAVSIVTANLPTGPWRNAAFAAMGGGQPVGFSIGLVVGGVLAGTVGWRWGYYIFAILNAIIFVVAVFGQPKSRENDPITWHKIAYEIDWIGAIIPSVALAMLSYVFASVTSNASHIRDPASIVLLAIGIILLPVFIYWMSRQERLHRPVLIPNSLWRNKVFTSICICVFLTWGNFNAFEAIMTFYFQDVQHHSPLQTSVRFLPEPIAGVLVNLAMGLLVHRVKADWLVGVSTALSAISPLLMALSRRTWTYWSAPFVALTLNAMGADALFTVSSLVITDVFSESRQALAGSVFQYIVQIGKGIGLATIPILASSVTARSSYEPKSSPDALFVGFQAAFWLCFAECILTLLIGAWGLRLIGKVGVKQD